MWKIIFTKLQSVLKQGVFQLQPAVLYEGDAFFMGFPAVLTKLKYLYADKQNNP